MCTIISIILRSGYVCAMASKVVLVGNDKQCSAARKKLGGYGKRPGDQLYLVVLCFTIVIPAWVRQLRRLLKCMLKHMPDESSIKKFDELLPGGDLRVKRNRWAYEAVEAAGKGRCLREGKIRLLVSCLIYLKSLRRGLTLCPRNMSTQVSNGLLM